jgi:hypothetical protein
MWAAARAGVQEQATATPGAAAVSSQSPRSKRLRRTCRVAEELVEGEVDKIRLHPGEVEGVRRRVRRGVKRDEPAVAGRGARVDLGGGEVWRYGQKLWQGSGGARNGVRGGSAKPRATRPTPCAVPRPPASPLCLSHRSPLPPPPPTPRKPGQSSPGCTGGPRSCPLRGRPLGCRPAHQGPPPPLPRPATSPRLRLAGGWSGAMKWAASQAGARGGRDTATKPGAAARASQRHPRASGEPATPTRRRGGQPGLHAGLVDAGQRGTTGARVGADAQHALPWGQGRERPCDCCQGSRQALGLQRA